MSDRPNAERPQLWVVLAHHWPTKNAGCICGWAELGKSHNGHQVEMLRAAAGAGDGESFVGLPDGTLDKLTADEWALIEHARAHPDDMVVRRPDGTLTVAKRECIAEGHATAVYDTDGTAEVWHDPDDGPCEWVWRIPGAES